MEVERIIFFDELGDVVFKRNKRAGRLTIRVKTSKDIRVTIPAHVSYKQAVAFVSEKKEWIRKTLDKLVEKAGDLTQFHELSEFSTNLYELKIERIEGEKILRKIRDGKILVSIPFTFEISSKNVQEKIRSAILEAWRMEAKSILPGRTADLARIYGFQYRSISIKNMKSRWGSCTGHNGINLNLHLVRLPDHLRDYIILHELVHTVHKNHGKYFWQRLDMLCGDAKGLAAELKKFRLDIW